MKQAEDEQESFFYRRIKDCICEKLSRWNNNQTHSTLNEKRDHELISRSRRDVVDHKQDVWWSQSTSHNSTTVLEAVLKQDLLSWILNEISET